MWIFIFFSIAHDFLSFAHFIIILLFPFRVLSIFFSFIFTAFFVSFSFFNFTVVCFLCEIHHRTIPWKKSICAERFIFRPWESNAPVRRFGHFIFQKFNAQFDRISTFLSIRTQRVHFNFILMINFKWTEKKRKPKKKSKYFCAEISARSRRCQLDKTISNSINFDETISSSSRFVLLKNPFVFSSSSLEIIEFNNSNHTHTHTHSLLTWSKQFFRLQNGWFLFSCFFLEHRQQSTFALASFLAADKSKHWKIHRIAWLFERYGNKKKRIQMKWDRMLV